MSTNRNYLLALLTAIMVFNYIDRLALGLLLQDIKVDLTLSDTQLGFLTGIAFAFFYATMGIPIARWADRGNRVAIISLTAGLWSVAVMLSATVRGFVQLLLIRVGVAIGEAGCHPPALSLIADYYTRAERPRAVARYMMGWPLALLIGYFSAGWLNELYGWRLTFLIIGFPGLVLAVVAALTLHEPRRALSSRSEATPSLVTASDIDQQPSMMEVLLTLWGNKAFRHLLLCFCLSYFFGQGILQWQPAFFIRSHGLETGELGTWFAVIYGVGGIFGTWMGGALASRYAADNERLQLFALAVLYATFVFVKAGVYLPGSHYSAFVMLGLSAVGNGAANGPLFAATQTLVPPPMRAMSIALVLFFSHLIGLGLGPLAVGVLSDALTPIFGNDALRYALLAFCPGYFWCTWHLWKAGRALGRDFSTDVLVSKRT